MKQNKETLKQFFETGDKPTQQQYADLIDSYVDAKQPEGEANRRFVIDEAGEVSVASEQQVPEYTLSPISGTNTVDLLKDGVSVSQIDLTPYLDNTNIARLVSGTVDANGLATFTRDDNSTFTVDLSNLKDNLTLEQVTDNDNITSNDIILKKTEANSTQSIVFDTASQDYKIEQETISDSKGGKTILRVKNDESTLLEIEPNKISSFTALRAETVSNQLTLKNTLSDQVVQINVPNNSTGSCILQTPDKSGTIALTNDIPQLQAGTNITIDNTDPLQPVINATGGSGGATDLSYDAATRTLASSTGTDAVIPLADATNAGLQKANFYEEGAFTPVLGGGTYTNGSTTGSSYVRIGNLVHLYLQIQNINGTGSTLDLNIGGMPFPASASGYWISSNMTLFNGSDYANPDKLLVDFNVGSGTLRFRELNGSYIENVNFSNGEVRLNITYRTNIYTP
ncbi:hypothetical protein ACIVBQ_001364 [Tenacibaculum discolor]